MKYIGSLLVSVGILAMLLAALLSPTRVYARHLRQCFEVFPPVCLVNPMTGKCAEGIPGTVCEPGNPNCVCMNYLNVNGCYCDVPRGPLQ